MQSYRILLTTYGSYGDLHPFMAIALELQSRGHDVVLGSPEIYRQKVESTGLEFAPLRPDLPDPNRAQELMRRVMNWRTGGKAVVRELALGDLRASYGDVSKAARGCDLIVTHPLTYSSPIVAEMVGLPWVYVGLQPLTFFSAYDPSVLPPAPWAVKLRWIGPRWYRFLMDAAAHSIDAWAAPIHELRAELGLPPVSGNPIYMAQYSPYLNLALFSKVLAPAVADWPEHTKQPGFAFYDDYDLTQRPLSLELERFLDAGDPPIVFTLGTAAVHDAGEFFHESLAAARLIGKRSVLLTGHETGNDMHLDLGKDSIAVDYAPFSKLFPRACVNVHQGGVGTTGQAIRAGRPMLIMPYAHDQPDNALRCVRLGIARQVRRERYTAERVARRLRVLTGSPEIRRAAQLAGAEVAAENGTCASADAIEQLLRRLAPKRIQTKQLL